MKGKVTINRVYYKSYTQTFNTSSSFQTFTVPATVTELKVDCVASKGADYSSARLGANGGRVEAVLPVTQGSILYFYVGDIPSDINIAEYNASDIRTDNTGLLDSDSLSSRLIVAGGGGSGANFNATAGPGGGLIGGNGSNTNNCGSGGTQTSGGAAGGRTSTAGAAGSFGLGGNGYVRNNNYKGGSGGAGWYGGGGGGSASALANPGCGGGGSSYTDISCKNVIHTQGYNAGSGYITINYNVESDSSDYDFYKDFYTTEIFKNTENGIDVYRAANS